MSLHVRYSKNPRLRTWGTYHLHGKTGISGLEDQIVRAIWFGKFQKIWAVICGDAIFLLFSVCSADLDILSSSSFSHLVKFNSFMFMHKISPGWFCVNGKHPWLEPF